MGGAWAAAGWVGWVGLLQGGWGWGCCRVGWVGLLQGGVGGAAAGWVGWGAVYVNDVPCTLISCHHQRARDVPLNKSTIEHDLQVC